MKKKKKTNHKKVKKKGWSYTQISILRCSNKIIISKVNKWQGCKDSNSTKNCWFDCSKLYWMKEREYRHNKHCKASNSKVKIILFILINIPIN